MGRSAVLGRGAACAGAVVAVLALVACSGMPDATPLPDGLGYVRSGGHVLVLHPHEDGGADALLTGVLGVNARGCVIVGGSVIVADGSSHLVGADRVSLSGRVFALGQQVRGGGGANGSTSADLDAALRSLCGVGIAGTAYFDPL